MMQRSVLALHCWAAVATGATPRAGADGLSACTPPPPPPRPPGSPARPVGCVEGTDSLTLSFDVLCHVLAHCHRHRACFYYTHAHTLAKPAHQDEHSHQCQHAHDQDQHDFQRVHSIASMTSHGAPLLRPDQAAGAYRPYITEQVSPCACTRRGGGEGYCGWGGGSIVEGGGC
jgi:hypothetical protein